MRRIVVISLVLIVALAYFFWQKPAAPEFVSSHQKKFDSSKPVMLRAPAEAKQVAHKAIKGEYIARQPRASKDSVIRVPANTVYQATDREPLAQNGRKWRWLTGAVAIRSRDVPEGTHVLSRRPGYAIVAEGDVPAGVSSLSLVEREDNGAIGIFTGVLRLMGNETLENVSQFQSSCPCELKESYAHIRSYLVGPVTSDKQPELQACLNGTGLFKRIEWEILESARITR